MKRLSRGIDRIQATFDDEHLVANAGLFLVSTLAVRVGIEDLTNATVRLGVWSAVPCPGASADPRARHRGRRLS